MARKTNYGAAAKQSFERLKDTQTIATAGGVVITPPLMEQIFNLAPEVFGQPYAADGSDLFDNQRLARTGARVVTGVVVGAIGISTKNEIGRGVGFGVGIGAITSVLRDWGVKF